MKNLVMLVAVFAGALVASARVSWLPLTTNEVVNFNAGRVTGIGVGLYQVYPDGSLNVWSLDDEGQSGLGVGSQVTNLIRRVLTRYFASTSQGTNSFRVCVQWESRYNSKGELSYEYGDKDTVAFQIRGRSPVFQFPASGEIPPEAFQVEADWLGGNYLIIPVKGQSIHWVELTIHHPDSPDYNEITRDGASPYEEALSKETLFLKRGLLKTCEESANNFPPEETQVTLTLWYDEGRTDGTEFRWMPGSQVVRREILPQQLSLSIALSGGLLEVTLSGGGPGGTYVLEPVPALTLSTGSISTQSSIVPPPTAVADTNGVATWSLHPTGVGEFFRARLR